MVQSGERFFTSLGFAPLPKTFCERSLFVEAARSRGRLSRQRVGRRPRGGPAHQDVHRCHRRRLHHHPSRARAQLLSARLQASSRCSSATPPTTASTKPSATPSRCRSRPSISCKIGLLAKAPDASRDIGLLLQQALAEGRVPALRPADRSVAMAGVQRRRSTPDSYNKAWWELRLKYQGVAPPVAARRGVLRSGREVSRARPTRRIRGISWRTSCSSSFIARWRRRPAAPRPLHRCSIYGSKDARAKLNAMLELGLSQPWPEALEAADRLANKWTRPRSATTSRRCRRGWTRNSGATDRVVTRSPGHVIDCHSRLRPCRRRRVGQHDSIVIDSSRRFPARGVGRRPAAERLRPRRAPATRLLTRKPSRPFASNGRRSRDR